MMRKVYQKTEEKANRLVWGFVIFLVITFCVLIKYGNFSTENKKEKRGKTAENGFHMKLIKTHSPENQSTVDKNFFIFSRLNKESYSWRGCEK